MGDEDDQMHPIRKLIREVAKQAVLYDSHNLDYKDNLCRQKAWSKVAQNMGMSLTECQIRWGTLRRCLANARKRQMKRAAIGSKAIKKWKYQEEMSFLLPFLEQREFEYIGPSKKRKLMQCNIYDSTLANEMFISEEFEPDIDDDVYEVKPDIEKLQMYVVENSSATNADEIYIEEDIENIPIDTDPCAVSPHQSSTTDAPSLSQQDLSSHNELLIDEMDSFFLSMSKALKKLPRVQQIDVRSKVYNLVTHAEMEWLQKKCNTTE